MTTLRDAVSRLFLVRMKLGEFDPPEMNPYTKYVYLHCFSITVYMHVYHYIID